MADPVALGNPASTPSTPASALRAVTPHAVNLLPDGVPKALWINDTAVVVVAVVCEADSAAINLSISGPGVLPVRAKAVRVTGTTATSIVAMY